MINSQCLARDRSRVSTIQTCYTVEWLAKGGLHGDPIPFRQGAVCVCVCQKWHIHSPRLTVTTDPDVSDVHNGLRHVTRALFFLVLAHLKKSSSIEGLVVLS